MTFFAFIVVNTLQFWFIFLFSFFSTGCIETSEAIMGVTKVLMASNDTLFNFEDTLGDRDDMFSPRHLSNSGSNTATPQPINCKTPTNEMYLNVQSFDQKLDGRNDELNCATTKPIFTLNLESNVQNLSELLSPEQQKTFSEDINTVEQLSSDLSATIDATNTLDDLKTCISVHMNEDNSRMERSDSNPLEPANHSQHADENETNKANDSLHLDEEITNNSENHATIENDIPSDDDSSIKSNFDSLEPIENAKENKNQNLAIIENDIDCDRTWNHNKTNELNGIISMENVRE